VKVGKMLKFGRRMEGIREKEVEIKRMKER
jgi:hypothetical protein